MFEPRTILIKQKGEPTEDPPINGSIIKNKEDIFYSSLIKYVELMMIRHKSKVIAISLKNIARVRIKNRINKHKFIEEREEL